MSDMLARTVAMESDCDKRESLLSRRVLGAAFNLGLVLLGLAFPIMI